MGKKNTSITFDEWHKRLGDVFDNMRRSSGYVPDPDTWCDIEKWESYYDQGLTPEEAYLKEC